MIVDDDEKWHNLYAGMLEGADYDLIHAYDGVEALACLEKKKPDLIILDLIMNLMTGDTFFLFIKSMPEYADIPVIVISNYIKQSYTKLKDLDPNVIFLNKFVKREKLIGEIKTRIR